MNTATLSHVIDAMVAVGEGRGFLIAHPEPHQSPLVITAAHCLTATLSGSQLPPPHRWAYTLERTYPNLVGPLGARPTIFAECLFVDPVADLAVLCGPDSDTFGD